jgi:hypothetical protein
VLMDTTECVIVGIFENLHTNDNSNTTQTLEYTKDKYNAKIRK